MSVRAFFDTNIFIYLYADNELDKQKICKKIIDDAEECITSTQILNEISNVMIKKMRMPLDALKAVQTDVRHLGKLIYVTEDTINKATELHFCYGFSYYDCLMLASALESDCNVIYTEDMNDGQVIESSLRIVNPFSGAR
jgi:putative PIN family toxin of toxin-antitoxin system